ncbi:GTPase-activating protein gyp8 [Coemansia sp. Benny D115]|nr:GTPase-activating protein gyp8 [Coemansia sp. Benny D115]
MPRNAKRKGAAGEAGGVATTSRSKRISQAINSCDLTALKLLARTGSGLHSIRLRRRAWPLLLNFRALTDAGDRTAAHPDEGQLALDVPRTSLPKSPEYRCDAEATRRRQSQLSEVVTRTLRSYPWLRYYQGFHELSMTFLCVFGSERPATEAAKMVALFFVRDAMANDFERVLQQLRLLYVILETTSPEVHRLLVDLDVPEFFAISWVLTWFAHDLDDFETICRIYDFLITMPPMQVVYMAAAMIKQHEKEILGYERDFAVVHTELAKLPRKIQSWQLVIEDSYYMQIDFPPTKLQHMGGCHLPKLSAVNTFERTWRRLDPVRPLAFDALVPETRGGSRHPLVPPGSTSGSGGGSGSGDGLAQVGDKEARGNRMAGIIDLTSTAQKARNLALQHRWPLMVATFASATVLMYAWMMMQQLQLHP